MCYLINFDKFKSIGIHWIALHVNSNNVIYFDSFGVEHIPKEIKTHRKQKYHTKYLQNTSIGFNNVWIHLHWIY